MNSERECEIGRKRERDRVFEKKIVRVSEGGEIDKE